MNDNINNSNINNDPNFDVEQPRGPNDITPFTRPGVIRFVCLPLNRAYFFEVDDCWFDPREFLSDLENNKCENKQLLADYKKFGYDNFDIIEECRGRQFFDYEKRRECFNRAKNNWKGSFY